MMAGSNEIQKESEEKMKVIKVDARTLNPNEGNINLTFLEPAFGKMASLENYDADESAGSVDESMLSEEEKKQVEEFVKRIDVSDFRTLNSYGANAQRKISTFSTSITETVKTKNFGEIGDCLKELSIAISSTTAPEKKGILGFFQRKQKRSK